MESLTGNYLYNQFGGFFQNSELKKGTFCTGRRPFSWAPLDAGVLFICVLFVLELMSWFSYLSKSLFCAALVVLAPQQDRRLH